MTRPTVVGIGASAGGVEALREFFRALPADTGAAFVVVVHLPPDRESKLAAILGQCTAMQRLGTGLIGVLRSQYGPARTRTMIGKRPGVSGVVGMNGHHAICHLAMQAA